MFKMGSLAITSGAWKALGRGAEDERQAQGLRFPRAMLLLARHAVLDPGVLDQDDVNQNWSALSCGARIFSAYEMFGTKFWVITEADRSSTTILLPEEY